MIALHTRWVGACVLMACVELAGLSGLASGQTSADGSIRGTVKDHQGGVLPGASVTVTSPDVPGIHTAVTDRAGFYRLLDLPPGQYRITVERPGFARLVQENVLVRAGLNLAVDVTMQLGALTETIEVKRETPLLETSSATQAVNISGDLQRALPLSGRRNWADAMFLLPGAVNRELASFQSGFFSVHGAANNANVPQLDGVDADTAGPGGFAVIGFSTDAIADVQVKTSGVEASVPSAFGAVLNVVTRSGSDRFQESARLTWQPRRWVGNNAPGGTSGSLEILQPDLSAGGPLLRTRAWFFGAFRYLYHNQSISRSEAQLADLRAVVPDFTPFDNSTRGALWYGKVTAAFSRRHQIASSYLHDRTPRTSSSATDAGPYLKSIAGGSAVSLQMTSAWRPTITTRVTAGYNNKGSGTELASLERPARLVHKGVLPSAGRLVGTGVIAVLDNNSSRAVTPRHEKTTLTADLTYYRDRWVGSHEFQVGVYSQPRNRQRVNATYPGRGFAVEEVVYASPGSANTSLVPFHRQIFDADRFVSEFQERSETAVYAQDSWRLTNRATITAGVRALSVRRVDRLFDVRTQKSLQVGPRLGVNYRAATHGLRASWGRVHELASRQTLPAGSSTVGLVDLYDTNLDGTFETRLPTSASTLLARDRLVDATFHQPYVDETAVGYRFQLARHVLVDVGVLHRSFKHGVAAIETNGIYEGRQFRGYHDERFSDILLTTNDVWTSPRFVALEVIATKQTDRLQWLASYTRQGLSMRGTWRPNDPAAYIQPEAFPNKRGVDIASSYSYVSAQTVNDGSRDHLVKIGLNYQVLGPIQFATTYVFQSGQWSGPIITRLTAPDPVFGPERLQLSNGRLVGNPLATISRFAFPTRADGQFHMPGVHYWNVRLGVRRRLDIGHVDAALDLTNVLNAAGDHFLRFGGNQTFSPFFRQGSERQLPRAAQVSVGFQF